MNYLLRFACLALLAGSASCSAMRKTPTKDNGKIEVVFVQVNDVYEIAPLAGGREGGMARVATLKKQYQERNPNTFLVMAGDFLSPSVYNSLQYEGKRVPTLLSLAIMNLTLVKLNCWIASMSLASSGYLPMLFTNGEIRLYLLHKHLPVINHHFRRPISRR